MKRHPFDLLMELPDGDIRLDCAALHVARDAYPELELSTSLGMLDRMAEEVAALRPGLASTLRYEAMRKVVIEGYELRGNADDYYDPDNCFLNRVLQRRLGIPISLSIVWIEVGRRLKWPVSGVGFPGHFLVRFDDPERYVIADPYHEGRALSLDECRALLDRNFNGELAFSPGLLAPVGTRAILTRLLNNLRWVYAAHHCLDRLETVLRRLSAVEPDNPQHVLDLARVRCQRGDVRRAHEIVCSYLVDRPSDRPGGERLLVGLRELAAAIAALN
jgi:regulator of sirC expression with transglutaminase-like and TPR domain